MNKPYISVVVPVYNEQDNLNNLLTYLLSVLNSLNKSFEIIFVNDGSSDNSANILNSLQQQYSQNISVIHLNNNVGQHLALMAGFENVHGEIIITLDADLQNPPENIPHLIAAIEQGHDVVNTYRLHRQDSAWRIAISRIHNKLRSKIIPKLILRDEGCMLRAYRRSIVDLMMQSKEASPFISLLALSYATTPTEIAVTHAARYRGHSHNDFYKLLRFNFDLITGFSLLPLQVFTVAGCLIASVSFLLIIFLLITIFFTNKNVKDFYILSSVISLMLGIFLIGLGVTGEYIGRIYQEVRKRPRFVVKQSNKSSVN